MYCEIGEVSRFDVDANFLSYRAAFSVFDFAQNVIGSSVGGTDCLDPHA